MNKRKSRQHNVFTRWCFQFWFDHYLVLSTSLWWMLWHHIKILVIISYRHMAWASAIRSKVIVLIGDCWFSPFRMKFNWCRTRIENFTLFSTQALTSRYWPLMLYRLSIWVLDSFLGVFYHFNFFRVPTVQSYELNERSTQSGNKKSRGYFFLFFIFFCIITTDFLGIPPSKGNKTKKKLDVGPRLYIYIMYVSSKLLFIL